MNKSNKSIKKMAKDIPVVGRVLKEKHELYRLTLSQKDQIDRLERKLADKAQEKKEILWPLLKEQILKAESKKPTKNSATIKKEPPFVLNWVVPAVTPSSGGQSDIFRTIKFLNESGHNCRIYIFDPTERSSLKQQKELITSKFSGLGNQIYYNTENILDCDAIFATHWLTAYPVYNFSGKGRKYYYAQGYEPHTQPAGYLSYLAESTYSFGFRGIVLGEWLAEKLSKEYGMDCDHFDFGYDPEEYYNTSTQKRNSVLYYAQPQKAHRGFELGIMALEIFHRKNPGIQINLFGADISDYKIPFPYKDLGVLTVHQLNELYNKCAAGLALSFTNISLIPLEMIAAGCLPVVNDAYQTRMIKYADKVVFAKQSPQAVADALAKAVRSNPKGLDVKLPSEFSWDYSNQQIESILIKDFSS